MHEHTHTHIMSSLKCIINMTVTHNISFMLCQSPGRMDIYELHMRVGSGYSSQRSVSVECITRLKSGLVTFCVLQNEAHVQMELAEDCKKIVCPEKVKGRLPYLQK